MVSKASSSIQAITVVFAGWFLFSIPVFAAQPSYELIARVENPSVNPGGQVAVEFYITGLGNVTSAKLTIYFPIDFLNSQDPGVIEAWYGTGLDESNRTIPVVRPSSVKENISLVGNTIFLSTGYFLPLPRDLNESINPPRVMGEVSHEDESGEHPPLVMYCNISNDFFMGGDYRIEAVLTYESNGIWHASRSPVVVHVNTVWERIQLGVAVATLLGGSGFVWKTRSWAKEVVKALSQSNGKKKAKKKGDRGGKKR